MTKEERVCVLLLDEMSISPKFEYDISTGAIVGSPSLPGSPQNSAANHALVFMVAGKNLRIL